MTRYKSYTFFFALAFLFATHGASVSKKNENNITTVDDQKIQLKHLLNRTMAVMTNDNVSTKSDKEIAKEKEIKQLDIKMLQADQLRIDNVDFENKTPIIETGKSDTATHENNKQMQSGKQDKLNNLTQGEIMLIHEELHEKPKEEMELSYYTKPMKPHKSKTNDLIIQNGVQKNEYMQTKNIATRDESLVMQHLNDEKKHLIKINEDKEMQMKQLEAKKKQLVKRIMNSIDFVVNNTRNITEKKDLKELKTIIKILGNVDGNAKENVLNTAKPPAGLLPKINAARKANANLFSGEGFAQVRGKNVGREYVEYSTRNYDKENERKEKHKEKVKNNLDEWLKVRELLKSSTTEDRNKNFKEKCEDFGWTKDKFKSIIVRPCCLLCCKKSYLGC